MIIFLPICTLQLLQFATKETLNFSTKPNEWKPEHLQGPTVLGGQAAEPRPACSDFCGVTDW